GIPRYRYAADGRVRGRAPHPQGLRGPAADADRADGLGAAGGQAQGARGGLRSPHREARGDLSAPRARRLARAVRFVAASERTAKPPYRQRRDWAPRRPVGNLLLVRDAIPAVLRGLAVLAAVLAAGGCGGERSEERAGERTIVFKHFRLFGDPAPFAALLREFEARHPGIRVRAETLPAASDEQHQFYVINLRGGSRDFDVLALDVIWVAEFARAGWIADVTGLLPDNEALFAASLEAVTYEGRHYAVPWFVDAGLLY